jgi:type II secretory pathway pseudopilin PulG
MVVIAIIAVLAAILIPTLGHARNQAREAATRATLTSLEGSIETYFTTFHSYPGPFPTSGAGTSTTGAAGKKLSGAQNLFLGLTFAMKPANPGGAAVNVPGSSVWVDPTQPGGPINYANIDPNGQYSQLSAFFSPSALQISRPKVDTTNVWDASGLPNSSAGNNSFAFPVLVDAFPDALPILYYRRSPGVNGTGTYTANVAAGTNKYAQPNVIGEPKIATAGVPSSSNLASFYVDENAEYTASTGLTSANGSVIPQDPTSSSYGGLFENYLASRVATYNQSAAAATRMDAPSGSYILMAAGRNRQYSTPDSIVVVGGH